MPKEFVERAGELLDVPVDEILIQYWPPQVTAAYRLKRSLHTFPKEWMDCLKRNSRFPTPREIMTEQNWCLRYESLMLRFQGLGYKMLRTLQAAIKAIKSASATQTPPFQTF